MSDLATSENASVAADVAPKTALGSLTKVAASSAASTSATPVVESPVVAGGKPAVPSPSAPAISGAAAIVPSAPAADTRGPIPFDRHESALKNAREQAATEALKPFAWASGSKPEVVQRAWSLHQEMQSNPVAFYERLGRELEARGALTGGAVTPPASPAAPQKLPEPDLHSPDGKSHAFSAGRLEEWAKAREQQLEASIMARLKPVMDREQQQQEQQEFQTELKSRQQVMNEALAEAQKFPHFKENEPLISAKLDQMDRAIVRKVGVVAAMHIAYGQVLAEQVFPGIESAAEKRVREDYEKKARASTGNITPNGGGGTPRAAKPRTVEALAAHMESLSQTLGA